MVRPVLRRAEAPPRAAEFLNHMPRSLWNGSDPFLVRSALPEEVATFEPAYAKALQSGNANEGEPYLVFLIPVTDATDELD